MIYVLSDIHGNERRFESILRQIRLQPTDTLYVLGDVIDRHPGGIRILRRLMAMPNARMLLGNHEYMMLRALGQPYERGAANDPVTRAAALQHWYRNGGKVTHDHLKHIRKTLRAEIVQYLHRLPLFYDVTVNGVPFKLVHAAPEEAYDGDPRYTSPTHFAVWKRWTLYDTVPGNYTMIFGHTPTDHYQKAVPMQLYRRDRVIGIDCGSGYPDDDPAGRLACIRLDDGAVFYSEETR